MHIQGCGCRDLPGPTAVWLCPMAQIGRVGAAVALSGARVVLMAWVASGATR